MSASVQVKILSTIGETCGASVCDIARELSHHPYPVDTIVVMIGLNILVAEVNGVPDANTILGRAHPEPGRTRAAAKCQSRSAGPISPICGGKVYRCN